MNKYDAIIIGSGQAANPLAKKLADAGWKTALIEKKWIGGCCINVGCTPTKTMIASGRVAYLVKRSADYGVHSTTTAPTGGVSSDAPTGFSVDMEAIVRRKNDHVLPAREGNTKRLLETPNVEVLFGNAAFIGPREVKVALEDGSTTTLTAEHIFINTGAQPVIPPIPGLDSVPYLTSSSILDLMVLPSHLVIIGGGYISLEFGQLYRRLGSEVTIIEDHERFLAKEDMDIAAEIKKILEEDGIRILTNTKVVGVTTDESDDAGAINVATIGSTAIGVAAIGVALGNGQQLTASHLLVATGRKPDTAGLNATAAGIALDEHGYVKVNDKLETNVPGIYALGDVKGGPQFTHIAYNDHLIVYKNLFEKANLSIAGRESVYCLFTDPELGRVGLTEEQARAKGLSIKVAKMPASKIARAWENDETRGMLKAIVDADKGTILGAAMLSGNGGELMAIVQMAMMGGITYDVLRDNVFAHPTYAEALNVLFATLDK